MLSASVKTAGLSDKKLARIAILVAPGIPKSGFISGANTLFARLITPNSVKTSANAPISTVIAIMYQTVLVSKSYAVLNIVLTRLLIPITIPNATKTAITIPKHTKPSTLTTFLTVNPTGSCDFFSQSFWSVAPIRSA